MPDDKIPDLPFHVETLFIILHKIRVKETSMLAILSIKIICSRLNLKCYHI